MDTQLNLDMPEGFVRKFLHNLSSIWVRCVFCVVVSGIVIGISEVIITVLTPYYCSIVTSWSFHDKSRSGRVQHGLMVTLTDFYCRHIRYNRLVNQNSSEYSEIWCVFGPAHPSEISRVMTIYQPGRIKSTRSKVGAFESVRWANRMWVYIVLKQSRTISIYKNVNSQFNV